MTRYRFILGAASLAVALGTGPALAGQEGGRPSGGSPSVGTATSSGGGSATSSSSSSSSSSSGSGMSSGSSSSSGDYGPAPRPSYAREGGERAPQRPTSGDRPSGGRATGGERAVPRGTASGDSGGRVASMPSGSSDRMTAPERRAVPSYSRPRDGRTSIGQAGLRTTPVVDPRRYGYLYDPYYGFYYDPFGYYGYSNYGGYYGYRNSLSWPGYGMGLSYFYDPFYDPFWYGGGGGYPGYYGSYSGYTRGSYRATGALRLKVRPRDAQVLVDGYFVGTVDEFDGVFQRLNVDAGSHRIELRAPGFAPVQFEVMVTPGETITYKGDMLHVQ